MNEGATAAEAVQPVIRFSFVASQADEEDDRGQPPESPAFTRRMKRTAEDNRVLMFIEGDLDDLDDWGQPRVPIVLPREYVTGNTLVAHW